MSDLILLDETNEAIAFAKKAPEDVAWVGTREFKIKGGWARFCELAKIEYDAGFGSAHIARDLLVVFKDGTYLERREYDGSEWWEYVPVLTEPEKEAEVLTLTNSESTELAYLQTLGELNDIK